MIKKCKLCEVEESEEILFHKHHIKQRKEGGDDSKENLIDICNDCHYAIHHPERIDGELKGLESDYKEMIRVNIFADGYGVVPNRILRDNKISHFSKVLYSELSSLCASRGYCWATNEYFARVFKVSVRTVTRALAELDPYIVIRNKMSPKRQIWVHTLSGVEPRPIKVQDKKRVGEKGLNSPKKKSEKKVAKKYQFTAQDTMLAEYLLSRILYNFPHFHNKKVNIDEWSDDMRKLREIDKATAQQIHFMITWVHGGTIEEKKDSDTGKVTPMREMKPNEFWSKNILSASKLRKQWFDNLVPQLQQDLKKAIQKSSTVQL
jgi:hypothetical protein